MNFWFLLIVLGVAWTLQSMLSFVQLKDFSTVYARLRRQGKVAIGKRKNAFSAGAIAMFRIDEDGFIHEAQGMSGLTIMARFKVIPGYEGMHIAEAEEGPTKRLSKGLRLAILNARDNWIAVQLGYVPEDPPGPLSRLFGRLRKNKVQADPPALQPPRKIRVVAHTT